jgi:hypothetical protein
VRGEGQVGGVGKLHCCCCAANAQLLLLRCCHCIRTIREYERIGEREARWERGSQVGGVGVATFTLLLLLLRCCCCCCATAVVALLLLLSHYPKDMDPDTK